MRREIDIKIHEQVGRLISQRRTELGITQLQLVSTSGDGHGSPSWLRKVERGEVGCSLAGYYRIFAALGLEPHDALPTLREVGLVPRPMDLPHPTPLRRPEREVGGLSYSERLAEQSQAVERRFLESRGGGEATAELDPEPDAA
jgi:transcriptional regulator with XRE-family HTH domain